jgi:hypothetical protein
MPPRTVRIHRALPPPAPPEVPPDEHLGRWLAELVRDAAASGRGAGPAAVTCRDDGTIEFLPLGPDLLRDAPLPLLLAALSRSELAGRRAVAVGLVGRFRMERRVRGEPVGAAVLLAFLEWADCRWVGWRRILDVAGAELGDGDTWLRAEEGDALPDGLGRWWSLGRRTGVSVSFGPAAPPPEAMVH